MQIETYEIEELNNSEASTMAADAASIELVEKLGLAGQLRLVNKETLTRFPYPRMTKGQLAVYKTLFPAVSSIETFNVGIIPLRVLQVIAFCKEHEQAKHMAIWHSAVPKDDPILIAAPTDYSGEIYLLARWGEALDSFEKLSKRALPLIAKQMSASLHAAKARLDGYLASVENLAYVYCETGEKPSWNIYD